MSHLFQKKQIFLNLNSIMLFLLKHLGQNVTLISFILSSFLLFHSSICNKISKLRYSPIMCCRIFMFVFIICNQLYNSAPDFVDS